MLLRAFIFALAATATIATTAVAPTSAAAAQVDFFSQVHGGWNLTGFRDKPIESVRSFRHASGKRQH
jgi:Spy/CpxP family protein refolding chaperone